MTVLNPTADFVTSSLNGAIDADDTEITIGTGLDLPAAGGALQIDYDSSEAVGDASGPETVTYTSYTTATGVVAGVSRGEGGTTGVTHANGASVQCAMSSVHLDARIGARAYLAADQDNLVDGNWTKVALATESYDYGSNFASNKFTVPAGGDGLYIITGSVFFEGADLGADKAFAAGIYKNGSIIRQEQKQTAVAASGISIPVSEMVELVEDDYIELYAYSGNGANTADLESGSAFTYMAINLLHK